MERSDWVSDLRYWHGMESNGGWTRIRTRLRDTRLWWTVFYAIVVMNMLALTVVALLQRYG